MKDFTLTRVDSPDLPDGWYVERYCPASSYGDLRADFNVYQEGGATWQGGEPRPELTVTVTCYAERYGRPGEPEVSWPSTSDKRPVLALALSAALRLAANEAKEMAS